MSIVEQQYWELGYSVPGILIGVYEIKFNLGKTLVLEIYSCIKPFSHYEVVHLVARREISLPIIMNDRIILKWMVSSSAGRSWIFWNQYNISNLKPIFSIYLLHAVLCFWCTYRIILNTAIINILQTIYRTNTIYWFIAQH